MTPALFHQLLRPVMAFCAGRELDDRLAADLNETFPHDGNSFMAIKRACQDAIEAGWMCDREHGGIRFGRVIKAGADSEGFSVDVVHMDDVAGPHHRHPNGEIDMVMPLDPGAQFDGHGAGWVVYPPGSEHPPTVSGGAALVLYLLPEGAIEFTK
ncbi:MAG: DUF4863 family protein [Gammaproteobacteria bacterium]|nr:DUF4863 family protein [Gammaproteobacteria bacterium]